LTNYKKSIAHYIFIKNAIDLGKHTKNKYLTQKIYMSLYSKLFINISIIALFKSQMDCHHPSHRLHRVVAVVVAVLVDPVVLVDLVVRHGGVRRNLQSRR